MRHFFKSIFLALSLSLLAQGSAFAADHATAQEATDMIKKVIAFYKANGPEKTYAAVNDPKGQFIYKDLYVFAGTVKPGGVTLAHGGNPKLLGKPLGEMRDGDGKFFVKEINAVAGSKEGKGWVDYKWVNPVTTTEELLKLHTDNVTAALNALEAASDEEMMVEWILRKGTHIIAKMPRAAVIRSLAMNHMIHHRGQLSVYMRINDVPLPGIYGPSADEQ